jgi:lycopene cyclase domain-containing protein
MTLTYLEFHALFVAPPVAALAAVGLRRRSVRRADPTTEATPTVFGVNARAVGVAVLALAAFVYTTPWDNYLIARGVWGYGEGTVLVRFGFAPFGEYLFFVAQTVLTALWVYTVGVGVSDLDIDAGQRALGVGAGGVVTLAGWYLAATDAGLYLGSLLIWAGPVLALQWGFGWPYLVRHGRAVALGVGVPTLYLWVADTYAIQQGVWFLSDRYTLGIALPGLGLPIEEAVFFLVTNVFVVQGLVLWEWVIRRWL